MNKWKDLKEFTGSFSDGVIFIKCPDGDIKWSGHGLPAVKFPEGTTFMYIGDVLQELNDAVAMRGVLELLKVVFEVTRPAATKAQADVYTQWITWIDSVLNGKKITSGIEPNQANSPSKGYTQNDVKINTQMR